MTLLKQGHTPMQSLKGRLRGKEKLNRVFFVRLTVQSSS